MVNQREVWIIFTFITSVAATSENCFSKTNDGKNGDMCKAINITCPSGTVIYNPDIVASSKDCSDRNTSHVDSEVCVGIPYDLHVEIGQCYWKQSCLIRFPRAPILNRTANNYCLKKAMSLRVNTLRCIRTESNEIFYGAICDKSTEVQIGPKASSGIILSHRYIPWNYKSSIFEGQNGYSENAECSININIRQDHTTSIQTEVHFFDIDTDNDKLVIDGKNIMESGIKRNHKKNSAVRIKFTSNCLYSKSGSGFVICFKKIADDKSDLEDASACKDLIKEYEGTVTMATSPDELCEENFSLPDFIGTNSSCKTDQLTTPPLPTTTKKTRKNNRKTKCDIKVDLDKFCDTCPKRWGDCRKRSFKKCKKCCKKYSKCERIKRVGRKNRDKTKKRKKTGKKNKAKSRKRNRKNGNK